MSNFFVQALQIALTKSDVATARAAVEQAVLRAEALALLESQLEDKINASKAARGEKPTRLSGSRRTEVEGFAKDAAAMQTEQIASFENETSGFKILAALKSGLVSDLKFWSNAEKHTHPGDMPVVQEFVNAKRELKEALVLCLASRPGSQLAPQLREQP